MNGREKNFFDKFADAAAHLGTTPNQVVSLKIRENVHGHEYTELLHALEHEAGFRSRVLPGRLQGPGYLIECSKTKVVLVEHETGLEILYIAGSIASLISIIPLVLRCWNSLRDPHGRGHRPPELRSVEIRRLDEHGHLVEERSNGLDVPWAAPLSAVNTALLVAVESIDADIQSVKKTVGLLAKRVDELAARPRMSARPRKKLKR